MTADRLPPGRHRGPPLERLLPAPRQPEPDDTLPDIFASHRLDRPANLIPLPPAGRGAHRAPPPDTTPDPGEWKSWLAEHYPWFVWPFLACCLGFFIGVIIFTVNGTPDPVTDLPTATHRHNRGLPATTGTAYVPVHEPNVTRPPLPAATLHPNAWHTRQRGPFTEHHLTGRRTASTSYNPSSMRSTA